VVAVMGLSAACAAGAGIGGTALGLALTLKDRIKHTSSPVTQLMNLSEGTVQQDSQRGGLGWTCPPHFV